MKWLAMIVLQFCAKAVCPILASQKKRKEKLCSEGEVSYNVIFFPIHISSAVFFLCLPALGAHTLLPAAQEGKHPPSVMQGC